MSIEFHRTWKKYVRQAVFIKYKTKANTTLKVKYISCWTLNWKARSIYIPAERKQEDNNLTCISLLSKSAFIKYTPKKNFLYVVSNDHDSQ